MLMSLNTKGLSGGTQSEKVSVFHTRWKNCSKSTSPKPPHEIHRAEIIPWALEQQCWALTPDQVKLITGVQRRLNGHCSRITTPTPCSSKLWQPLAVPLPWHQSISDYGAPRSYLPVVEGGCRRGDGDQDKTGARKGGVLFSDLGKKVERFLISWSVHNLSKSRRWGNIILIFYTHTLNITFCHTCSSGGDRRLRLNPSKNLTLSINEPYEL